MKNQEVNQHKTPASIITLYNLTTLLAFLDVQNFCELFIHNVNLKTGFNWKLETTFLCFA